MLKMEDKPQPQPHAVCIPSPAQSHIKAMLKFSKLLHHKGFRITFVNTEFNQARFLKALGGSVSSSLPGFRFETIPDGMAPSGPDSTQDLDDMADSVRNKLERPFVELLTKIITNDDDNNNNNNSNVCVVSDGFMTFTVDVGKRFGIPVVQLFTIAASGLMGYKQYRVLMEKQLVPLKDKSILTSEFLDTTVDWVPGMKDYRFRDLPDNCWITDPKDALFNLVVEASGKTSESSAVVIQTFDTLEHEVLSALSSTISHLYAIGPLQLLLSHLPPSPVKSLPYSLWKEDSECIDWLNSREPNSVIYVNFGSITVLTPQQMEEFCWGLANSNKPFLWVVRQDLVKGEESGYCFAQKFSDETRERSLIVNWCPQEDVLNHASIGGFLTHCGWNSIIESVSSGVPMLCYMDCGEQPTNCWLACNELGVGLRINKDVKRDKVEGLVRDLLESEKGKEMKAKAMEWKKLAHEASDPQGSSFVNLNNLVDQLLVKQK